MNSTALHDLFRADVRDEAAPHLWPSSSVYSYMDDAQKMFCRLQGGIADASSAITILNVLAGAKFVAISPLILKIRDARRVADNTVLQILNIEDLQHPSTADDYGRRAPFTLHGPPGRVRGLVAGMDANRLKLIDEPTENQQIQLVVYRMPLLEITGANQPLEIDAHHHRHLAHWMKHLAHQKQDAETYDRGRSDMFRAEFVAYCDTAKAEREKLEHKYRTIAYGGI